MAEITFDVEGERLSGDLLPEEAPASVDTLHEMLPLSTTLMHVRWSGHAVWINIDSVDLGTLPRENHTVYPSRGDVLLYPGYRNEQEILLACGPTCFKSPAGELAGNHVATLDVGKTDLETLERETLETGEKSVTVTISD